MNTHSDSLTDLAPALCAAQAKITPASKDAVNPHFKNKYASLQSIWDVARPVLSAHGLAVIQTFSESDGDRMNIVTTIIHKSGQYFSGTLSMKPQKADPQGIGSAITYGRRYALAAILGIVADDDDDGQAASTQTSAPKSAATVKPALIRPAFSGWRAFAIPFGKQKGKLLGELTDDSLSWWCENYQLKATSSAADEAFRAALDAAYAEKTSANPAGGGEPNIEEDVPFGPAHAY